MKIRRFRDEDAYKVYYLIRKCILEINSKDYSKKVIKNLLKLYSPSNLITQSKTKTIFVASSLDNKIYGTINIKDDQINGLYVNPLFSKKGVGTKLMKKAEAFIKRKYSSIILYASLSSVDFYIKLGYKKIDDYHCEDYGDYVKMVKK